MKMEQEQVQSKLFEIGQLSGNGSKYHQGDDLEKAVECYDKAYKFAREVNDDKTERTCAFNLGAAYVAIGNPEEGLKYLHKALPPDGRADDRSNGDLYFNMGLGHEKMDDDEKALVDFTRASEEYSKFERDKTDLQIQCLEKCFQIYQRWRDFSKTADVCKKMAEVFNGRDELSQAERLCECATQLRIANEKDNATDLAAECKQVIEKCKPQGQDCIVAGKIWNDLGLVYTQLQEYDEATVCFEKAVEQVRSSHKSNPQLEAVVLQNLGAAYNFQGDYQRAIKFHEDAAVKYASLNYRNGQGQCFTNLAFALSQLGDREMKQAEIAFHHALQASIDTGDQHMKWQALEGLGAVNFNQGNVKEAVDFFISALQSVGENKAASERIKNKMLHAMKGPDLKDPVYRGQGHMMHTGSPMATRPERRVLMPTHGPAEEHHKLSTTPRSQVVESPIVAERFIPVAGERPAMSAVQDTPPRRIVRMRKKDSIGPHHPKVARGLGSITYDSPRFQPDRRNTMLQEETSEDESSSSGDSGSSSETESGEDEADQPDNKPHQMSLEKIEKIFERPKTSEYFRTKFLKGAANSKEPGQTAWMFRLAWHFTGGKAFPIPVPAFKGLSPGGPDEEKHLSMYEAHIRAKEEDEENEESGDEDSSDESSSSSDDDDETETETGQEDQTNVKQPYAPPPVPTQSPPNTTVVSTKHLDTYLTPDPHTVHTVADVHQQSDSSHRVARQPPQKTAESPREKSSTEDDSDDDDDKNDDKDPYATVDTATKLRQTVNEQGNDIPAETGFKRQRSREGRRSENFFESDHSSLDDNEKKKEETSAGEGTEDPYNTLDFEREGQTGEGESSAMKFEQLPRGQKEVIMAQYHHEHQGENAPPLPARQNEKSSKTCVIM